MIRRHSAWWILAVAIAIAIAVGASPITATSDLSLEASPYVWDGVDRIVAIGDVHGSYAHLESLLRSLDLVGESLEWTGGEQHLVMVGDLLDRGPGDRPILDLMMRLEGEAAAAGGRVHVVLGNHEVMNLVRDLRYVSRESHADFVDLEREEDRRAGFKAHLQSHRDPGMDAAGLVEAFDETHPLGYYGRLRAFDAEGPYGAWLLGLPAAIRINGIVFVHGGLTDRVAGLGLDGLNRAVETSLRSVLEARSELERSTRNDLDRREMIENAMELAGSDRRGSAAAEAVLELMEELPFVSDGPFWYRGNSVENERLERWMLDRVLGALEADALVIGHTPTASGRITTRFEGRLFRTDVGMVYGRPPMALVIEAVGAWVFDPGTLTAIGPLIEPPQGEGWGRKFEELPDLDLERFLRRAELADCRVVRRESRQAEICEAEKKGLHLRAVFVDVDEPKEDLDPGWIARRYQHEVAAYRLDRMLGFDLVPVTVLRQMDGRQGSLRIWVDSAIDLPFIREHDRWDLLTGLESRIEEARLFNYLISGRDRLDAARMLIPLERKILLGDHSKAFPVSTVATPGSRDGCESLGARLELALRELDADALRREMDDLLSGDQLKAVLLRRDALLEHCTTARRPAE